MGLSHCIFVGFLFSTRFNMSKFSRYVLNFWIGLLRKQVYHLFPYPYLVFMFVHTYMQTLGSLKHHKILLSNISKAQKVICSTLFSASSSFSELMEMVYSVILFVNIFVICCSDEYILPKMAERDLRRFANLRSTSSELGLKLPLDEVTIILFYCGICRHSHISFFKNSMKFRTNCFNPLFIYNN